MVLFDLTGCGPSGMFFLHAVATKRKALLESGDLMGAAELPNVTCFERNSLPGGVWRSERSDNNENNYPEEKKEERSSSSNSTNMYEALWTNANSGNVEFFDYTFLDHFKGPVPLYFPRKLLLEYMIARVTQHEDIFEHVQFNTSVESVKYDESIQQFIIQTKSLDENGNVQVSTSNYDKCIWASGENGKPKLVRSIMRRLKYWFNGTIVHSSEMDKIGPSVKGKRIMLIGDSFSAEDLALQCIKLGAERMYITSRYCQGVACDHGSWPQDKVELLQFCTPHAVRDGHTIVTKGTKEGHGEYEIEDISIIIFCTGYDSNMTFLDPSLLPWTDDSNWVDGQDYSWKVEEDWRMKSNCLTPWLGHVEPDDELALSGSFVYERLYKRVNIYNPNMMYIFEFSDFPLLDIDIAAYQCLRHVLGEVELPSQEKMLEYNRQQLLDEMDDPYLRKDIDWEYKEAMAGLSDDFWNHQSYRDFLHEFATFQVGRLTIAMEDANYPLSFGTRHELNKTGELMCHHTILDMEARFNTGENEKERVWRTFRDRDPSQYTSLITGEKPVPLKKKWIEIDPNDELYMLV